MSDPNIGELDLPLHFTNIQRALQLARQFLTAQETPNRQVILITDGLPTAHFEEQQPLPALSPPRAPRRRRCASAAMRPRGIDQRLLLPNWSQTHEDAPVRGAWSSRPEDG
ncbi:MAG: hypothetical protein U0575_15975 [Phycisphaerales bacterium]